MQRLMEYAQIIQIWEGSGLENTRSGVSKKGYRFAYYYKCNVYVHCGYLQMRGVVREGLVRAR